MHGRSGRRDRLCGDQLRRIGNRESLLLRHRKAGQENLDIKLLDHSPHDRLQSGQVNCRNFPKLPVIKPLVLVPQDVSDPDDGLPRSVTMPNQKVGRQRLSRLRDDLGGALDALR
jgi:hypothetical protein